MNEDTDLMHELKELDQEFAGGYRDRDATQGQRATIESGLSSVTHKSTLDAKKDNTLKGIKNQQRNKAAAAYSKKEETKAEKLRKKMQSALENVPERMKNQRTEVIKEVEPAAENLVFKTVERGQTVMSIQKRKLLENWVDNKYHPNYN